MISLYLNADDIHILYIYSLVLIHYFNEVVCYCFTHSNIVKTD